jgi:hypothetical protein
MNMIRPTAPLIQRVAAAALTGAVVVESVWEGVSTYVYRLRRGAEVFYLRDHQGSSPICWKGIRRSRHYPLMPISELPWPAS